MSLVLTVDDSKSMRQMVSFTLQAANFEVVETVDGVDALEWAKTNVADLVLVDVNMPRMDGITLVQHLRELNHYKFVPILMLTTEASPEKKMAGKQAGATGWIVKPFNPDKLIATINRVIG